MTLLDDRARHAVSAINESVSSYQPPAAVAVLVARRAFWRGVGWTTAAATAMALFVFFAVLTAPDEEPEVADPVVSTTIVTTTVPPQEDGGPDTVTEVEPSPVDVEEPTLTTLPDPVAAVTEPVFDTEPPPLQVTSPLDGAHFESAVVTFTGTTEPGVRVVAAGKFEVDVDGRGTWTIDLVLSPGANSASFVATDDSGNETSVRLVVHLDAAEPPPGEEEKDPPPPPPPPSLEFTAFQTYGSCSEAPPYDIFHGSADPGTTVAVSSAFGSGSAMAGEEGDWEVKVFFPEAPYGETFIVTAKDHNGVKRTFEFVSYAGG